MDAGITAKRSRTSRMPFTGISLILMALLSMASPSVAQAAVNVAPPYSSSMWRTGCNIYSPDADPSTCVELSGSPDNTQGTYTSTVTLRSPNSGTSLPTPSGSSTRGYVVTNFEVVDTIPKGLTFVTYTATFRHSCVRTSNAILTTDPPFSNMYVFDDANAAYIGGRDIRTELSGSGNGIINPCEGPAQQTRTVKLTNPKGGELPSGKVTVTINQQFSGVALQGFTGEATFVDAGRITVVRTTGAG